MAAPVYRFQLAFLAHVPPDLLELAASLDNMRVIASKHSLFTQLQNFFLLFIIYL
jgi:hypothetical protein